MFWDKTIQNTRKWATFSILKLSKFCRLFLKSALPCLTIQNLHNFSNFLELCFWINAKLWYTFMNNKKFTTILSPNTFLNTISTYLRSPVVSVVSELHQRWLSVVSELHQRWLNTILPGKLGKHLPLRTSSLLIAKGLLLRLKLPQYISPTPRPHVTMSVL